MLEPSVQQANVLPLLNWLPCFCGAGQVVDGPFQVGAFGRGRCNPRDKSSGPPLLTLSLKVKRNSAHGQSSAFVVTPGLPALKCAWTLNLALTGALQYSRGA